jgi:hypothetical protein
MPHLPDHATHDPELIAAFAAGDATGSALDEATALVAACADCAALHRDLRAISTALPELPAPTRPRDFRLAPEQADALRPSGWRGLVATFASPRFRLAAPLGTGLAAAGLAGLLLATPGGLFSAGSAVSGTAATAGPAAAPEAAGAGAAGAAPAENEAGGVDTTGTGPELPDEPKVSAAAPSAAALAPVPQAAAASSAASADPDLLYAQPNDAPASQAARNSAIAAAAPSASPAARLPDEGGRASGGVLSLNADDGATEDSGSVVGGVVPPILALASLIAGLALIGLRVVSRRVD